ncbi:phytoene/squalene synthase family protein [Haloglomus irregulare]|jgi:phytoene synthase|uniref:Phytoene/squalene synthase family protein n=1 Tax=Haloglomus irregulare TaxID=2234134 RepID=A0A554ND68_9EURY|nr:phytoene/squalene synthase family protein [Haloglomus irregulare]TSD15332.1 phytoene/squalene synthase family protein [Haloglomus irregulare]
MVDDEQLSRSRAIHRRTGRTFYYATRLLPERVRHATYVLYAFFRVADEVVDDAEGVDPEEQRRQLEEIRRAALTGDTDDPVLSAFAELRAEYDIPDEEVDVFIDAMGTDIEKSRYRTYSEVEAYMRGSAAAVGVMMTYVMRPDDPEEAIPAARRLGEAFQMSNFIRDVREDIVERDRIYLPLETLESRGVTAEQVERLEYDEAFAAAIRDELQRTEALYREGVAGINLLPRDCQLPVLTAAVLYADHHRLIRERDCDVLAETPSLSTLRKIRLVIETRWRWFWTKDPEAVFATVSDVPSSAATSHDRPGEPMPAR